MGLQLLEVTERNRLKEALEKNAANGTALQMGRTTSFLGYVEEQDATTIKDQEVVDLIRSIPCHY